MKSEMTKNERSALVASYDVNGVHVNIDIDFVKSYLVRGNAENITDQELVFFLNTCKSQKLNPLVQGERQGFRMKKISTSSCPTRRRRAWPLSTCTASVRLPATTRKRSSAPRTTR